MPPTNEKHHSDATAMDIGYIRGQRCSPPQSPKAAARKQSGITTSDNLDVAVRRALLGNNAPAKRYSTYLVGPEFHHPLPQWPWTVCPDTSKTLINTVAICGEAQRYFPLGTREEDWRAIVRRVAGSMGTELYPTFSSAMVGGLKQRYSPETLNVVFRIKFSYAVNNELLSLPFSQLLLRSKKKDVPRDDTMAASVPFSGLANLYNSCFLNAVLQMLYALGPPFTTFFSAMRYRRTAFQQYETRSLANCVGDFFSLMDSRSVAVISPIRFRALFGFVNDTFQSVDQHDAHECLTALLDRLEDESGISRAKLLLPVPAKDEDSEEADKRRYEEEQAMSHEARRQRKQGKLSNYWKRHLDVRRYSPLVPLSQGLLTTEVSCAVCCRRTAEVIDPFSNLSLSLAKVAQVPLYVWLVDVTGIRNSTVPNGIIRQVARCRRVVAPLSNSATAEEIAAFSDYCVNDAADGERKDSDGYEHIVWTVNARTMMCDKLPFPQKMQTPTSPISLQGGRGTHTPTLAEQGPFHAVLCAVLRNKEGGGPGCMLGSTSLIDAAAFKRIFRTHNDAREEVFEYTLYDRSKAEDFLSSMRRGTDRRRAASAAPRRALRSHEVAGDIETEMELEGNTTTEEITHGGNDHNNSNDDPEDDGECPVQLTCISPSKGASTVDSSGGGGVETTHLTPAQLADARSPELLLQTFKQRTAPLTIVTDLFPSDSVVVLRRRLRRPREEEEEGHASTVVYSVSGIEEIVYGQAAPQDDGRDSDTGGFYLNVEKLDLQQLLATFFQPHVVDMPRKCMWCGCRRSMVQTMTLERCPPLLILHLKRFAHFGYLPTKVSTPVMQRINAPIAVLGTHYRLKGIVSHHGIAGMGHYTAQVHADEVREKGTDHVVTEGGWFRCDDEDVTKLPVSFGTEQGSTVEGDNPTSKHDEVGGVRGVEPVLPKDAYVLAYSAFDSDA